MDEVKVEIKETGKVKKFFTGLKDKAVENKDKLVKAGLVVGGTVVGIIGTTFLINKSGVDYDEFEDVDYTEFIDLDEDSDESGDLDVTETEITEVNEE